MPGLSVVPVITSRPASILALVTVISGAASALLANPDAREIATRTNFVMAARRVNARPHDTVAASGVVRRCDENLQRRHAQRIMRRLLLTVLPWCWVGRASCLFVRPAGSDILERRGYLPEHAAFAIAAARLAAEGRWHDLEKHPCAETG